jgi:hypothetical protein
MEITVDCKGNAVECKWDASENAIIKEKTQLVCNTVNMDSNKLDRLYPESINKCECKQQAGTL